MKKITKRDVFAFLLGVLALFLIETILNWKEVKADFLSGYNLATQASKASE